jgi:putative acetyltransferase
MPLQLRHETPNDIDAIEAVTIAAFADAPHTSHTEQCIVRALRAADELTLSIVAVNHGKVVGHVALSPVTITDNHCCSATGWYGLGPISVLPQRQGQGIGSRLMEQALAELRAMRAMRAAGCVLLGDPAYYARFGFEARPSLQLPGVPPGYFMALALHGPVPEGIAQYSDAFNAAA